MMEVSVRTPRMMSVSVIAAALAVALWAFDAAAVRSCFVQISADCCDTATPQHPDTQRCCSRKPDGSCAEPCPDVISSTKVLRQVQLVMPGTPAAWTSLVELSGTGKCKWMPVQCIDGRCYPGGPSRSAICTEHLIAGEKCVAE